MQRFVSISRLFLINCLLIVLLLLAPLPALAASLSPAPEGATVYLIEPSDDATVTSPFVVQFGLSGMGIAPAGVDRENTGHHHLLIDMDELPSLTEPLQASDRLKHFGAGQTEVQLNLLPGDHTLQLVLGNASHVPHQPPVVSEKVTVHVR